MLYFLRNVYCLHASADQIATEIWLCWLMKSLAQRMHNACYCSTAFQVPHKAWEADILKLHLCSQALEGLRVILGVRPQTLATMVPKLLRGTMTSTNCRALGSLAEVAGPAISPHLSNIFPPLLRLASQPDSSSFAGPAAKDALIKVSYIQSQGCSHTALWPLARRCSHT